MNNILLLTYKIMDKKKSYKKFNKTSTHSCKKQDSPITVKNIFKQINQLKKQLVSIKSKKHLLTLPQHNTNIQQTASSKNISSHKKKKISNTQHISPVEKQNAEIGQLCACACAVTKRNIQQSTQKKKYSHQNSHSVRIDLYGLTSTKSRQIKLKSNISINRLRLVIQKISNRVYQQPQLIQGLVKQINQTISYMNKIIKQYQQQITDSKKGYKQMKAQLSQITSKVITMSQLHKSDKGKSVAHIQQIQELKRHLSYYIQLMEDNKQQADKCAKNYTQLEALYHQLQKNHQLTKKQLKISQQKKQKLNKTVQQLQLKFSTTNKEHILLLADLDQAKTQQNKNKQKRKQIQNKYNQLLQQHHNMKDKLNIKQVYHNKVIEQNKQLHTHINNIKLEHSHVSQALANYKSQVQRLQRQIAVLGINTNDKQMTIKEQEQDIQHLKENIQEQRDLNRKLTSSLEFCQMEIDNLSDEVDQLRKANQNYKNQLFRNKVIHQNQHQSQINTFRDQGSVSKQKTEKELKNDKYKLLTNQKTKHNFQSKNRQKALQQIQSIIQRHKKNQQSQQDSNYQ